MRCILALTLLCAVLAARADGFSYGKSFRMLNETDQLAVIHLDETTADVSMYIAIDGIPAGETITYVLPFWYRPDGFAIEEMNSADYRTKYVKPAHEKVVRMNRLADKRGSGGVLSSVPIFGLGFLGPLMSLTIKARGRESTGGDMLNPYAVHTTAHARAELYTVPAKDLPQLVAQAGLPAKYAEPLKKYNTSFFAVMRLTGSLRDGKPSQVQSSLQGAGVCYHFRHAIPPEKRGEYVYPLGTGAAWPKPILLTEVYVTCPDRFSLRVTSPESGTFMDSRYFNVYLQSYYSSQEAAPRERSESSNGKSITEEPLMTGLLSKKVTTPSAWHVAYLNSNPREDIRIRLAPRPMSWRLAVADSFARSRNRMVDPGSLFCYTGPVLALLGWLVAGLVIIRPRRQRADKPGSLLLHTLVVMLVANIWLNLGLAMIVSLGTLTSLLSSGANPLIPGFVALLGGPVILGTAMTGVGRSMRGKSWEWLYRLTMPCWLLATAIYLALNGILYLFVLWCEAAV